MFSHTGGVGVRGQKRDGVAPAEPAALPLALRPGEWLHNCPPSDVVARSETSPGSPASHQYFESLQSGSQVCQKERVYLWREIIVKFDH